MIDDWMQNKIGALRFLWALREMIFDSRMTRITQIFSYLNFALFAFFGALREMIFDSRMTRMTRITQIFSYLNFALFAFLEALRETLDTRIG